MSDALVSGLVTHRQAMLDELYSIHGRAKRLLNDVAAIEAAIVVLEPAITLEAAREIDLAGIESKAARTARHSLSIIRKAGRPMRTREIALEMMRERGLDIADYGMLKVMTGRVQASLRPQRAKGVLRSSPGDGPELLWEIVGPTVSGN